MINISKIINEKKASSSLFYALLFMMTVIIITILLIFYYQHLIINRYVPKHNLIINVKNQLSKADNEFDRIYNLNRFSDTLALYKNMDSINIQLDIIRRGGEFNNTTYLKPVDADIEAELDRIKQTFYDYRTTIKKVIVKGKDSASYRTYFINYKKMSDLYSSLEDSLHNHFSTTTSFIWQLMLSSIFISVILFVFMMMLIRIFIMKYRTANNSILQTNKSLQSQIIENKVLFDELNKKNSLLNVLLKNLNGSIIFEDVNRKLIFANTNFSNYLSQVNVNTDKLNDCKKATIELSTLFKEPLDFISDVYNCTSKRFQSSHVSYEMKDGKVLERDYIPVFIENQFYGHLWYFRDTTERVTMFKRIEESERKYRYLFEQNPNPMWIFNNRTLQFLEVNNAAILKYGYSRDEFLERTLLQIRPEDTIESARQIINQNKHKRYSFIADAQHVTKKGTLIEVELHSNIIDFNGIESKFVMINDVTQRNKARKELLDYQEHLEKIINDKTIELQNSNKQLAIANEQMLMALKAGNMAWWDWSIQTNKLEYATFAAQVLGFTTDEIGTTPECFLSLIHHKDLEVVTQRMQMLIDNEIEIYDIEFRIRNKTGNYIWCKEYAKVAERFPDNKPKHIVGIAQDITAQKKAESEKHKWHHLMQHANWGINIRPLDSPIIEMTNQAFAQMHGYQPEELIGFNAINLLAEEVRKDHAEFSRKIKKNGQLTVETIHVKKDGTTFPVLINTSVVEDEASGELYRIVNVQDITERLQLEKQNRLWATLIQNAKWGVYVTKAQSYKFEMMNQAFAQMHGYTVEELNQLNTNILIDESVKTKLPEWIEAVHKTGSITVESLNLRKDGSTFPVIVNITVVRDKTTGEEFVVTNIQDISERKRYETKLEEAKKELDELNSELLEYSKQLLHEREKYKAIAENFPEGRVLLFDKNLRYLLVNGTLSSKYIIPTEALLNKTIYEALPPEAAKIMEYYYLRALAGEKDKFEYKVQDAYFEIQTVPIKKQDNSINTGMALVHDITSRKVAEEKRMHALQKEKELNEMKSGFITIASHQFRTPLTTIQSSMDILKLYFEDLQVDNKSLFLRHHQKIIAEIKRLTELMTDILIVGRQDAGKTPFVPQNVDIVQLCNNLIHSHFTSLPDGKKLTFQSVFESIIISLDIKLISHSISNLVSNAIKYCKTLCEITITEDANSIIITVSDDGVGIPLEEQSKIFSTFYRASNVAHIQGTGLGLVIVKHFIELHNGTTEFESIPDVKTIFRIRLPKN